QRLFGRHKLFASVIVAEAVSRRFERSERLHVGLILRRIHATGREGNLHVVTAIFGRLLHGGASAEHDQVRERNALVTRLTTVEMGLNALQLFEHRRKLSRVVYFPILLRFKSNSRTVRAAALVGAAERRR